MGNRRLASALALSALIVSLATNLARAQGGGPQIGRAVQDIGASIREGTARNLISTVRECYRSMLPTDGPDNVAYCFGLDYSANQLRQAFVAIGDAESQRYFSIEKVLTRANRALHVRKIEQLERGPLIAFWANSTRSMLRRLDISEKPPVSQGGPKIESAKIAVLKLVKDPASARLYDLKLAITPNVRGDPTEVVCGKISERTSPGNFTPRRPFVYFVDDQSVNYDNGSEDIDREVVKNFCAK
jgi:hypothetical protein